MNLFNYKKTKIQLGLIIAMSFIACQKSAFLDPSPNPKLIVPETLQDFRLLLDNAGVMNGQGLGLCPGLGEFSTDNYYLNNIVFENFNEPVNHEIYSWGNKIFLDPQKKPGDWSFPYRCIAYSNVVLEGLKKVSPAALQQTEYNDLKGSALFFRAHMYYQLMQIFAPVYERSLAKDQYGVPLRLDPDIGKASVRAKVEEVYEQILRDLSEAEPLLPDRQSITARPSKSAVYGLLARMFLSMQEYDRALEYANRCLLISNELIDYNSLSASSFFPFERFNKEIIFYSILNTMGTMNMFGLYDSRVDNTLYNSYASNDLRKVLFYLDATTDLGNPDNPGITFRGSYDGTDQLFAGIATDEIYLIRAECYARAGNISAAMGDLNTLMRKRWNNKVSYPVFTAADKEDALRQILTERRKELISRGVRWTDLRRLNKEGANITITRVHQGKNYTLQPNSLQYTFLIPNDVIDFNPGMPQNPR